MEIVSSVHFLLGPAVAFAALGVIAVICRWVFSTDARDDRAARRLEKALATRDYGLLVPVATVRTDEDAAMLREVLASGGVRANVTRGDEGVEVRVFSKDLARARSLVASR